MITNSPVPDHKATILTPLSWRARAWRRTKDQWSMASPWLKSIFYLGLAVFGGAMISLGIDRLVDANQNIWNSLRVVIWGLAFCGLGIAGLFREMSRRQEIARQKVIAQLRGVDNS
jgi:hypothetical protein